MLVVVLVGVFEVDVLGAKDALVDDVLADDAGRAIVEVVPFNGVAIVALDRFSALSEELISCAFEIMVFPSVLQTAVSPDFLSFCVRGLIRIHTRIFSSTSFLEAITVVTESVQVSTKQENTKKNCFCNLKQNKNI